MRVPSLFRFASGSILRRAAKTGTPFEPGTVRGPRAPRRAPARA